MAIDFVKAQYGYKKYRDSIQWRNEVLPKELEDEYRKHIIHAMKEYTGWKYFDDLKISQKEVDIAWKLAKKYITVYPPKLRNFKKDDLIRPNIPDADDMLMAIEMLRNGDAIPHEEDMSFEVTLHGTNALWRSVILENYTKIYKPHIFYGEWGLEMFTRYISDPLIYNTYMTNIDADIAMTEIISRFRDEMKDYYYL